MHFRCIADALEMHCRRSIDALQTHYRCIADALQLYCRCIADRLRTAIRNTESLPFSQNNRVMDPTDRWTDRLVRPTEQSLDNRCSVWTDRLVRPTDQSLDNHFFVSSVLRVQVWFLLIFPTSMLLFTPSIHINPNFRWGALASSPNNSSLDDLRLFLI